MIHTAHYIDTDGDDVEFGLCGMCHAPIMWDDEANEFVTHTDLRVLVLPEKQIQVLKTYYTAHWSADQATLVAEIDAQLSRQDPYDEEPLRQQ